MSAYSVVSRDPFARLDVVRRVMLDFTLGIRDAACEECGCQPASHGLFEYGIEYDDKPGRPIWDGKLFCSIGCRRSYFS